MRLAGAVVVVFVIGCEALRPTPAQVPAPLRVAATPTVAPKAEAASEVIRASAVQAAPDDPLVLVARCLERADHRGAAVHLETYVRAHPDQPLFRLQLAELYLRCGQPAEAKFHGERFVEDAAGVASLAPHAVTAHIKLMELAQRADDRFGELYHRGAGLLLLVKTQDAAKDRDARFCEEMLCQALRALTDAKELKPNDPRARTQLAAALERAGSRRAAGAERAAARASVTGGAGKVLE